MMNLIVCEGKTDQVFLGYYLRNKFGYKFKKKQDFKLSNSNEYPTDLYYSSGKKDIGILNVNGCSNFTKAVQIISERLKADGKIFSKILYIADRDMSLENKNILISFYCDLHPDINIDWKIFKYMDGFEKQCQVEAKVLILPEGETGALETVFLNAIKGQDEDKQIVVSKTVKFIDSFNNEKQTRFLIKDRHRLKAKFLTTISIIEPIRSFDKVDELIKMVDFDSDKNINQVFDCVKDLVELT